jgi:hypothetical protein
MTNGDRDTRDIARDTPVAALSDEAARAAARQLWHESGGTLTGKAIADRFGRSARWGQDRRAEAQRAARPRGTPAVADAVPRQTATTARPGRAAARGAPAAGTPVPVLVVAVVAFVVVTAVCAVVSYSHIRTLAQTAGMGSLAGWLPLGLDGLVVACSCSLIVDRRRGVQVHALARAGAVIGLAASLAANVIAVDPDLVPIRVVQWVLAGYGPVALAVSAHLLLRMLEDR